MGFRQIMTEKGQPMEANYDNMPNSSSAIELQIEEVGEYIDSHDMHDKEMGYSTQEVEYWEKHRGWYYLQFHHPNDNFFDIHNVGDDLLTSDNTLTGAYFWKTPEEALHFILADCDLPRKQQILRGYNICRISGPTIVNDKKGRFLHHEILWEPPADLGYPVEPCLDEKSEAA
jgi:hypothetical protein